METRELIAKVRKIEIKTRRIVDEISGGAYHSVFKGRGIEFSEVREYTAGDDVRDIDWNVTARMGNAYIKKYVEERELTVLIVMDVSASGDFGTIYESKREKMAECAALLAFSAVRNHDKVGLLLYSDRTELYLPPRSGKTHALRLIREMMACEPRGTGTDLDAALEHLAAARKKRAVIFLISDFSGNRDYEQNLKILNQRHDVAAFRITDPWEWQMPLLPGMVIADAETGEHQSFTGNRKMLKNYSREAEKQFRIVQELFTQAKVDIMDLKCGEDPVKPLMKFFRTRWKQKTAGI